MPHSHFGCATCIDFQFVSSWLQIISYKAKREFRGFSFHTGCRSKGSRLACIPSTNGVLIKNHSKVNIFLLNCAQTWLMKMGVLQSVWRWMRFCALVCMCWIEHDYWLSKNKVSNYYPWIPRKNRNFASVVKWNYNWTFCRDCSSETDNYPSQTHPRTKLLSPALTSVRTSWSLIAVHWSRQRRLFHFIRWGWLWHTR